MVREFRREGCWLGMMGAQPAYLEAAAALPYLNNGAKLAAEPSESLRFQSLVVNDADHLAVFRVWGKKKRIWAPGI